MNSMKKWVYYFYPKTRVSYFEKLKTLFFINLCFFGVALLLIAFISDFWINNGNLKFSLYSKALEMTLLIISLFILKSKGIKVAGNIISFTAIAFLLLFMNIIPNDINLIYKYTQGYYSVLLFFIIGLLFASRKVILINSVLIFLTITRIYVYTVINDMPEPDIHNSAYLYHTIVLLGITVIIFYANKFTELTIIKANKEIEHRKIQNQALIASDEEIRATNEELVATTDALIESNNDLIAAIEKAKESDRLKTEFLNNMSHEVRTPMNGIIGFSQLLGIANLDKKTQQEYVEIIQKSGNQLLAIIDSIIEISKLGTGQVQLVEKEINLNKLLCDLYSVFNRQAKEKGIVLLLNQEYEDSYMYILIDELKLQKILNNLLDNAIKFTEKGTVEFGFHILKSNQGFEVEKEEIKFYVKDTGIGIEEEKQINIFEKFSQAESNLSRQYGGLGLGLAIANENAQLMGGIIGLTSERGVGSTFTLTIPYKKQLPDN